MTRRAWAMLGLVVLATGLSASPWWRGFGLHLVAPALLGAAAAAPVAALLASTATARLRRLRPVAVVGLDVAAAVLFGLVVLTRGDLGALVSGLWRGPMTLLSYSLPLVDDAGLLAVPVALTWVAGASAGHAVARGHGLGAVVPVWVGGFVVAEAGTRRALLPLATESWWGSAWLPPAALLAVLLAVLAVQAAQPDPDLVVDTGRPRGADGERSARPWVRALAAAVALVVTAVVATAGLADPSTSTVADRRPASARAELVTAVAYVVQLRTREAATTPVLDVDTNAPWSGYVGLAELDRYDGDSWTFVRRFQPSGGLVPPDADPALAGPGPIQQRYRVRAGLAGSPWLPHLPAPRRVVGQPVDVDPNAALAVPAHDLASGEEFEVVSAATSVPFESLPATAAFSLSRPAAETQLPAELQPLLSRVLAGTGEDDLPLVRLQALLTGLRRDYRLAPSAGARPRPSATTTTAAPRPSETLAGDHSGSGTAFADVMASILGPARSGSPEQFATLFAAAARSLGVPARLVSGLRARDGDATGPLPPGRRTLTAAQAWTWVELPVQGQGWVVADPTPTRTGRLADAPTLRARTTSPAPSRSAQELVVPSAGGHAVAPPEPGSLDRHGSGTSHLARWLIVTIGLAALGALAWLLLRRPRGGRGRPQRREQIAREWQGALATLTDSGVAHLEPLTATEIAALARERFGDAAGEATTALADLADAALFAPSRQLRAQDVAAARALRRDLTATTRAAMPRSARLLRVLRQGRRRASSSWGREAGGTGRTGAARWPARRGRVD